MFRATILLSVLYLGLAEREHKVHNIILYPDKYSWCTTTPIQQVVAYPGYEPVTIANNICVGACYSYSIPTTQPAEPGERIGPYCDSCQPSQTKCYHVTLHSPTQTFQKRVQIIQNCTCTACDKINHEDCEITDQTTLELPSNLFANQSQDTSKQKTEDIPELLHVTTDKTRYLKINLEPAEVSTTPKKHYELNTNLITLLKTINNADDDDTDLTYDTSQLRELLGVIKELNDKNLMDFVNFVNTEYQSVDLEVDLSRLKEVLTSFQKNEELMQKHREFGLGSAATLNSITEEIPKHHHIGEEVQIGINVAHLVKGPHGSMILTPNLKVEEKLNIDSAILKPNHDGVVIAYENPNKNHN